MNDDAILAALARIEAAQGSIQSDVSGMQSDLSGLKSDLSAMKSAQSSMRADFMAELGKTRADIMERIDRQQARLDSVDEHLTMGLGYTDRVDRRTAALTEDNRLLGELMMSLTRSVRSLEGRVNKIEERKP